VVSLSSIENTPTNVFHAIALQETTNIAHNRMDADFWLSGAPEPVFNNKFLKNIKITYKKSA
jgi:hypothetical protein